MNHYEPHYFPAIFQVRNPSSIIDGWLGTGEDAWKAIDIAEVMKKAGSPVPPEMQQAPCTTPTECTKKPHHVDALLDSLDLYVIFLDELQKWIES